MKDLSIPKSLLSSNGNVLHLDIIPEQLSEKVILVENSDQVKIVSSHFSEILHSRENGSYLVHTGTYKDTKISVISTGKCSDNIDIMVNELDAIVNIDLKNSRRNPTFRSLHLVKLGTTIGIQEDMPTGTVIITKNAGGFDGLLHYYRDGFTVMDEKLEFAFMSHTGYTGRNTAPYFVLSDEHYFSIFNHQSFVPGITISTPGFYGSKGNTLRLPVLDPLFFDKICSFQYKDLPITNYDTGSAALYGLSSLLGHKAISLSLVISNKITGEILSDSAKNFKDLVKFTLDQFIQ